MQFTPPYKSVLKRALQCTPPYKSVLKSTIFLIVFRKYLPVLKGFPAKYIHAPWTAPESVQKAARCIIGQDYPAPIVDHNKVSRANLEKLRNIFKALLCYKDSGKMLLWFIHVDKVLLAYF